MNSLSPSTLSATATQLTITWSDGVVGHVTWQTLRSGCPCATCRVARAEPPSDLPVLSLAEAQPIRATGMHPVGNYAYQIDFNDGHRSGIFSLELLRELSCPSGPRN
ncbi:MAG: DUF971 domain-containing protein [Planctomycetota bacterium]|nr:DUF971 domain-containing protein [Planctomycetota bacterium]